MANYATGEPRRPSESAADSASGAVDDGGDSAHQPSPNGLAQRLLYRHVRDQRGRYRSRLLARGELQVLPRRTSRRLHLSPFAELYDVRFFRRQKGYLWQSAVAVVAILAVLLMVDSVADAALAAGLGASAVIVFVHPSSRGASLRNLIGGHSLGLLVGAVASLIMFQSGWHPVPDEFSHWVADIMAAGVLGVVILMMAVTDTEHPPAAATALGFALQSLAWQMVILFIAAVLVLAVAKVMLRNRLHDLIH